MPAMTVPRTQESPNGNILVEAPVERWTAWPVNWSAVWVGVLASTACVILFGLMGVALGAHLIGTEHRVVDLKKIALTTLALSVVSAFLSFVVGGWAAGKTAGILRSEPAMLHGAIVWLTAIPVLVVMAGLGAGSYFGGWYGGLAGTPAGAAATTPYEKPEAPGANATEGEKTNFRAEQAEYNRQVNQWREETPKATQNAALGAITALLLSLIGSVIGGWMASGEPMSFSHHRTRGLGKPELSRSRV